jgi:photosystem II stability/assembly factor-like uncharacterized protein
MLFLSALIAATSTTLPAAGDWIVAQGTGTCAATDVDFSDFRHGLASCAFGDAMTTSDGGLNWSVFPTGLQQSLVFAHAASANELYLARLGLYRSTNGGSSWSEVGNLSSNFGSVFEVHFDGVHYVALQGGSLLYSNNSGSVWQVGFPAQPDVYLDELHFPSSMIGYATGGITSEQGSIGSVVRTQDGGVSWALLSFANGQITAADFRDPAHGVVATISSNVYATSNSGASWQVLGSLPNNAYLTDLGHGSDTHWYGAAADGCVYESFDGGSSWNASICDPSSRPLAALTLRGGPAIAVGNGGLVLYENRILRAGFD